MRNLTNALLGAAAAMVGAISPIGSSSAWADPGADAPVSTAPQAPDVSAAARIKQLEERIDQRDAIIRDLEARVERLEREAAARGSAAPASGVGANQAQTAQAQTAQTQTAQPPPAAGAPTQSAAAGPAQPPPANAPAQATAQSPPAPPSSQQASATAKPGPGQFEVSADAAQHALERALVQTGAALLPAGKFEFVPSLTFQYQTISTPAQIALTSSGQVLITESVLRNTQVEASGLLRAGLPWNSQLEVALPLDFKRDDIATRVNRSGLADSAVNVAGVGDFAISLTKQVLIEGDVRPGLFVGVGWNSNLGQVKHNIPLGTGFDEFTGSVTIVKRQDPLVFQAGFTYEYSLEHNGLTPGQLFIPTVGLLFAISPETSLGFSQQLEFGQKAYFHGLAVPGSEQTIGIFRIGLLSILGKGRVVNFSVGIGETPDSPNVSVQLAFPIRLN